MASWQKCPTCGEVGEILGREENNYNPCESDECPIPYYVRNGYVEDNSYDDECEHCEIKCNSRSWLTWYLHCKRCNETFTADTETDRY